MRRSARTRPPSTACRPNTVAPPGPGAARACCALPPHRSVLPLGSDGRLLGLDPASRWPSTGWRRRSPRCWTSWSSRSAAAALLERAVQRGVVRRGGRASCCASSSRPGRSSTPRSGRRGGSWHRAESTVVVSGDGPLAVGHGRSGWSSAGVGTVYTETGGNGAGRRSRHRARSTRTGATGARRDPGRGAPGPARMPTPRRRRLRLVPDLVVLADALAPEPARLLRLHAAGGAHLPVRLRDGVGVIGPLVLPGRTRLPGLPRPARGGPAPRVGRPSRRSWPAGVGGPTRRRRRRPRRWASRRRWPPWTRRAAAGTDRRPGRPPWSWTPTAGTVARRAWTPHPDCGCGAGSGGTAAPVGFPTTA